MCMAADKKCPVCKFKIKTKGAASRQCKRTTCKYAPYCYSHRAFEVKKSDIPGAQNGGFAARDIRKNEVISDYTIATVKETPADYRAHEPSTHAAEIKKHIYTATNNPKDKRCNLVGMFNTSANKHHKNNARLVNSGQIRATKAIKKGQEILFPYGKTWRTTHIKTLATPTTPTKTGKPPAAPIKNRGSRRKAKSATKSTGPQAKSAGPSSQSTQPRKLLNDNDNDEVKHDIATMYGVIKKTRHAPDVTKEGGGPRFITAKSAERLGKIIADPINNIKRVYVFGSGNGQEWNALSYINPDVEFTGYELGREHVEYAEDSCRTLRQEQDDGDDNRVPCPTYIECDVMDKLDEFMENPDQLLARDGNTLLYSTAVIGPDFYHQLALLAEQSPRFRLAMFYVMFQGLGAEVNRGFTEIDKFTSYLSGSNESKQIRVKMIDTDVHETDDNTDDSDDDEIDPSISDFKKKKVAADGNCFFSSIAYTLLLEKEDRLSRTPSSAEIQSEADKLRERVVEWMKDKHERNEKWIDMPFQEEDKVTLKRFLQIDQDHVYGGRKPKYYFKKMSKNKTYATNLEIQAIARVLKRRILVRMRDYWYDKAGERHHEPIAIVHNAEEGAKAHYDALIPKRR